MLKDELSDFLPVVLEFASVAPLEIAANLLASLKDSLEKLEDELTKANSPYQYLIAACRRGSDFLQDVKEKGGN